MNCYFCKSTLEACRIGPENALRCIVCPPSDTLGNANELWKSRCVHSIDDDSTERNHLTFESGLTIYLYKKGDSIALTIYKLDSGFKSIFIIDDIWLDIFNIPQDVLENKIKTWIMFQ